MDTSTLHGNSAASASLASEARSTFLRLQSDERIVALIRRGNDFAFETLVGRYRSRLLSFCNHMLGSMEDAEDVLQEVFAASYNAMKADDRPLNVRPWLYRIARNRCLNHLRKPRNTGMDSMDIYESVGGATTADRAHDNIEFRELLGDVRNLPETQRTALLLREMGSLSYEQISETMDTTVPSVKSLLVRARVALAEAAAARKLTCAEVRIELAEAVEGITKVSAPARRHVADCDRCRLFKKELRANTNALAALAPLPFVPLFAIKKLLGLKIFSAFGGGAAGAASATTTASTSAALATGAASTAAGGAFSSGLSAGITALATKAAAGVATAAIVTAGATQVKHVADRVQPAAQPAAIVTPLQPSIGTLTTEAPIEPAVPVEAEAVAEPAVEQPVADPEPAPAPQAEPPVANPAPTPETPVKDTVVEDGGSTVVMPDPEPAPAPQEGAPPAPQPAQGPTGESGATGDTHAPAAPAEGGPTGPTTVAG